MKSIEAQLRCTERLLAISHELVANPFYDDILHHIVQVATELVDCETAGILLLDESSNMLRFVAVTQHKDRLFNIPVPLDVSIAGAAFTSNRPVIVHDVRVDPRYYPKVADLLNYPAHSLLAVPLTFRERKIGVLEAENKKDDQHFDEADAQVMTVLAAQATIAIENARLFEQYKQLAQREQLQRQMADALRLASAAITSTLDYDQVIDRILEQVYQVIPSDTSNIMMIEAENIARVVRGRGYNKFGTTNTLNKTTLNVSDTVGLHTMYTTHQPLVVSNVSQDPNWVYSRPEHRWIQSYVGAPIVIRNITAGFLNVMSATPNTYQQSHAEWLQVFAYHAATAIENARLYRQAQEEIAERLKAEEELRRHHDHLDELIKERTAEVHRLAITDSLTDLFNRHHLMLLGSKALHYAERYRHALAAMMIDIDHFKLINDTYGHAVGDEALRKLANQLRKNLRSADIVGRYGGEEFIVLMPETDLQTAHQIAERLLINIHTIQVGTPQAPIGLTVSIGVTALNLVHPQTLDNLIAGADRAMYVAKQAGRDQVFAQRE